MNGGTIIKFSGHSDDIICIETIQVPSTRMMKFSASRLEVAAEAEAAETNGGALVSNDEISAASDGPTKILVQTIGGARGCYVYAHYDGCWHFSVCQLEESRKLPNNWTFEIDQMEEHEYSARLTIDACKRAGDLLDKPIRVEE